LVQFFLNHHTKVEESGFKCSNGQVYPIDWVLVPPKKLAEQLFKFPLITATFVNAVQATDLQDSLSEKGLTAFIPTNSAWGAMNKTDLVYLFSPVGREDLKKILQYHISSEVVYSTDLMEQVGNEIELPTMLEEESILIQINNRYEQSKRSENSVRPGDCWLILNEGAATVQRTDCIAENGTSHWINSVLIPKSVFENLPSRRLGQGRH